MAIDELKLKEDVKEYYSTLKPQYISKLVEAVVEDIIDIIDDQPKLSLENKTSDKWIPCSERLPEDEQTVITSTDSLFVLVQVYREGKFMYWNDSYEEWAEYADNVLAWMPLPEPYKGE